MFGVGGLTIPLQTGQERPAKSRLGTYCAHQNESTGLHPSQHDRAWLTYEAGGCFAQVGGAGLTKQRRGPSLELRASSS